MASVSHHGFFEEGIKAIIPLGAKCMGSGGEATELCSICLDRCVGTSWALLQPKTRLSGTRATHVDCDDSPKGEPRKLCHLGTVIVHLRKLFIYRLQRTLIPS